MALLSIVREATSQPMSATLVLLHGLGADEHDLMGLAPYLDPSLRIVCPRAPLASPWGGNSWFATDIVEGELTVDGEEARESLALLEAFLREQTGPVLLGGFSQGAMMTLGILLEHGSLIEGAIAMSGGCLPFFQPQSFAPKPVFISHGRMDPVVPYELGEGAAEILKELQCPVEFRAYDMPHTISEECLRDLGAWVHNWRLNRVLA